jgi:hypothetical protein
MRIHTACIWVLLVAGTATGIAAAQSSLAPDPAAPSVEWQAYADHSGGYEGSAVSEAGDINEDS